jgi:aspartyl-tRNA(Asn)/glutamyl-tRNA(Gln) amidotransferase subunit A
MELHEHTFSRVKRGLVAGDFSSRELAESVLARIELIEPKIAAFVRVRDRSEILSVAEDIDRRRLKGDDLGPLAGVPVAVKDNISTRGLGTTCGSKILRDYDPPFDATAVERLVGADAVVIGKTNLDEFAMGSSTENSAVAVTRNPWDVTRVPGGSSGGSAAAVASGEVPLSLGSDTGGSVRQPAGFCGVVGAKPSYGRVSRYGLVAFASSLDQIGAISRDVEGAATLLGVIAGEDGRDATTSAHGVPDYVAGLKEDLSGMSIGIPSEYFAEGLDEEIESAVMRAVDTMRTLGASVSTISLPHTEHAIPAYYLVANAEASSNLARYDGVRYGHRAAAPADLHDLYALTRSEGFGPEVKRRIMLGTYALSAGYYDEYYLKAQKVRSLMASDFAHAFSSVDAIVTPTSPTTAFEVGARVHDPLQMYLADIYTISANLAGIAALSVPCGLSGDGLPIGLQIMVDKFREDSMFRVAYAYEQASQHAFGVPTP